MDCEEYFEEYYLLVPGELKAIVVKDGIVKIVDGHYSTGSKLNIKETNDLNYLRYGSEYIGIKDGVLSVCSKTDQFDSLVTYGDRSWCRSLTKLKAMGGYLDSDLKVNTLENALSVQCMWPNLVTDQDIQQLHSLENSTKEEISYISVDGVNLLDEDRFFYMLEGESLSEHALCNDDNSLWFYCQGTRNLNFKFELINNDLFIFSPGCGYLEIAKDSDAYDDYDDYDVAVFSETLRKLPITLIETEQKGTYLLGNNGKYVEKCVANSFSNAVITDDPFCASKFQFVLINENLKDWC